MSLVYVLNKYNKPLMPCSPRKARLLLKQNKAVVIRKTPFTIKLLYGSSGYKQPINLGIDTGSKVVGFSSTTKDKELFAEELTLRNDIKELLSTKRESRRTRRNRLRYRAPRFNNRRSSKKKGWLAPSIKHKINAHISEIEFICSILPISKIIVEVAAFDTQLLQNPEIENLEYQKGPQFNFWNVREYILFRDDYKCQHCKGKSKDKILEIHHLQSRKIGWDAPNNLICLCKTCHDNYHKGLIDLKVKRGKSYRDAAFMSIMRWTLYNTLGDNYSKDFVEMTYGYITKSTRISNGLPKAHYIDARCISGNPLAKPLEFVYLKKDIRRHNRKIHKSNILKGNRLKLNQAPFKIKGFRLYDKVTFKGKECFITGRRSSGYFKLVDIEGNVIHNSACYKDIKYKESRKRGIVGRVRYDAFLSDLI